MYRTPWPIMLYRINHELSQMSTIVASILDDEIQKKEFMFLRTSECERGREKIALLSGTNDERRLRRRWEIKSVVQFTHRRRINKKRRYINYVVKKTRNHYFPNEMIWYTRRHRPRWKKRKMYLVHKIALVEKTEAKKKLFKKQSTRK